MSNCILEMIERVSALIDTQTIVESKNYSLNNLKLFLSIKQIQNLKRQQSKFGRQKRVQN